MTSVKKASRGSRGSQEKVGEPGQQLHEALWGAGAVFRGRGAETMAGSLLINELSKTGKEGETLATLSNLWKQ